MDLIKGELRHSVWRADDVSAGCHKCHMRRVVDRHQAKIRRFSVAFTRADWPPSDSSPRSRNKTGTVRPTARVSPIFSYSKHMRVFISNVIVLILFREIVVRLLATGLDLATCFKDSSRWG